MAHLLRLQSVCGWVVRPKDRRPALRGAVCGQECAGRCIEEVVGRLHRRRARTPKIHHLRDRPSISEITYHKSCTDVAWCGLLSWSSCERWRHTPCTPITSQSCRSWQQCRHHAGCSCGVCVLCVWKVAYLFARAREWVKSEPVLRNGRMEVLWSGTRRGPAEALGKVAHAEVV